MIIQPQFLFFPTVFLRLLLPLLAKSLMSELSTFEGRSKPRISSSSSFEFPENLFDLASLSIFLMLGHFFNSKTRKNLLHPFYKRQVCFQNTLERNQKKNQYSCKTQCFWYQMKTLSLRNALSTCFIPRGVSFPSYSQSKMAI